MPFNRQSYTSLREKLDAERDQHRGRGYAEFVELYELYTKNRGRLPLTVIAYLFSVGSVNTIKSWASQLPEQGRGE